MKPKVAMIFGILGGMFGLLIGLYGYSLMAVAGSSGMRDAGLIQIISIATPIASFVGGFIVTTNPGTAGTLMILSAAAMVWVFGWNAFTAVPLFLSGIGGCLALDIAIDAKRAARASEPGRVEPLLPERAQGVALDVDDGQSQLPLEEDADQTRAAASSVSPAYYAARRHEPARRPPLEDRSFELAKLAVAGVVALAAIGVAGVLGWKYLDTKPTIGEVRRELQKETRSDSLPLMPPPVTPSRELPVSNANKSAGLQEKGTSTDSGENPAATGVLLAADSVRVHLKRGDVYRFKTRDNSIGVSAEKGRFSLQKQDGQAVMNCPGSEGVVWWDRKKYGDSMVLSACSDEVIVTFVTEGE